MSDDPNMIPSQIRVKAEATGSGGKGRIGLAGHLRGHFLAGILVSAPITITIYMAWLFLDFVDRFFSRLIPETYNPNTYLPFAIPGLGIIVALVFFISIGWFARYFMGRVIFNASEFVMNRIPLINTVHNAIKQVFEMIMGSQAQAFREVVLFEYPRANCWTLGFVTGTTKGEIQTLTEDEVVNIYVPTTPNPTSGFLLFVPRKDLVFVTMSVEDAIKLIVSGGIITPPEKDQIVADNKPVS